MLLNSTLTFCSILTVLLSLSPGAQNCLAGGMGPLWPPFFCTFVILQLQPNPGFAVRINLNSRLLGPTFPPPKSPPRSPPMMGRLPMNPPIPPPPLLFFTGNKLNNRYIATTMTTTYWSRSCGSGRRSGWRAR